MQSKSFLAAGLGLCALILALLALHGANAQNATNTGAPTTLWPTTEWQTASPEQEGMDSGDLAKLIAFGKTKSFDSLLIARHGRIVLDAYYAPYSAEIPHAINSSTKAVIGTLIAMLLKDGKLDSLDHPVLDFFTDRGIANLDDRKKAITVQNLLNMTSGLDWDEGFEGGREQSLQEMLRSPDWVQYILDRPMAHAPGEVFYYNSGGTHLLSAIVTKLTGKSAENFARERLFAPLGIGADAWRRDPQGVSTGGFGLALTPRDMARIGYFYLRKGQWGDALLLPPDWIAAVNNATISMNARFEPALRYANLFWALPDKHVTMAVGYHCQVIMVLPDVDIVAVMTARDFCPFGRLADDISGAVKSQGALPPSPDAVEGLAKAISDVATETPSETGPAFEIASAISGKTYSFPRNALDFRSVALFLTADKPHLTWEIDQASAPNGVLRADSPIGLDGLYRKNVPKDPSAAFAYRAMKGTWLDGQTFAVDLQFIGQGEQRKWILTFSDDRLTLKTKGRNGRDIAIEGEVQN